MTVFIGEKIRMRFLKKGYEEMKNFRCWLSITMKISADELFRKYTSMNMPKIVSFGRRLGTCVLSRRSWRSSRIRLWVRDIRMGSGRLHRCVVIIMAVCWMGFGRRVVWIAGFILMPKGRGMCSPG
jgi:hypothetical protein